LSPGERLLLAFSRTPTRADCHEGCQAWGDTADPNIFTNAYPGFPRCDSPSETRSGRGRLLHALLDLRDLDDAPQVRARHGSRLDRTLQQLAYPKLIVLDELGDLPLSREEASLFFRLLVRRYERGSLIVTSNKGFTDWGEVFNDHVLATAILDRLPHHATTVNITGDSYRLREKRKAGLLGRRPPQTPPDDENTDAA